MRIDQEERQLHFLNINKLKVGHWVESVRDSIDQMVENH